MEKLSLPLYQPDEKLEDYLRRCMADPGTNTTALARAMGLNRTGLYRIRDGTGQASPPTLTRFGAVSGVLKDTPETRETLTLLRLLDHAEIGWRAQAGTVGEVKSEEVEALTAA